MKNVFNLTDEQINNITAIILLCAELDTKSETVDYIMKSDLKAREKIIIAYSLGAMENKFNRI